MTATNYFTSDTLNVSLKFLISCIILFAHTFVSSQNFSETYWHFGETPKGLYFDIAGNPPVVTNNSYTPYTNEGCSVLNNPTTGALMFYTDGIKVVDATHNVMPNGSGLLGNISSAGSGKLALDPIDCNKFYIIHSNSEMIGNPNGTVYYTKVDMTLPGNGTAANPLGDVIALEKNIFITDGVSEALEVIPEIGSRNSWILSPSNQNSSISIYHLTSTGIAFSSTVSMIGTLSDMRGFKYSPVSGKACIISILENQPAIVFEFDASTGVISNQIIISGTPAGTSSGGYGFYDTDWSSDGTKVYLSKYRDSNPPSGGKLYQFDTNNIANPIVLVGDVSSNVTRLSRGIRLAPNGKIYWLHADSNTGSLQYVGAVNSPNVSGVGCNTTLNAIDMGSDLGVCHEFPTFIRIIDKVPTVTPQTITANTCNDSLNIPITPLGIFNDPEGDQITVDNVSAHYGNAVLIGNEFHYALPSITVSTDTITVHYCDDFCFPQCGTAKIIIQISSAGAGNVNPIIDNTIDCAFAETTIAVSLPGYQFAWSNGATTSSITVNQSGEYSLHAHSSAGCDVYDTVLVTLSSLSINLLLNSSVVECNGNPVTLTSSTNAYNLLWSTGETGSSISVNQSGTYSIIASDGAYCNQVDSINIFIGSPPPAAVLEGDSLVFCENANSILRFVPVANTHYEWNTGDTTSYLLPTESGFYSIVASNACGNDTSAFLVSIINCDEEFYAPNSFTPDGDGHNDVWFAKGYNLRDIDIKIFNRWGEKIFEATDIETVWTGNVRGGAYFAQDGVYVYVVTYKTRNGGIVTKRGHITLIR